MPRSRPDKRRPDPRNGLLAAGGLAVLLLAAAVLLGYRALQGSWPWEPPGTTAGVADIGGPFTLVDGSGREVTEKSWPGKWLLVFFGFTHCPDVCPTTLADLGQALDQLGPEADRLQPLFVTVDPERDTPAVMRDYVAAFGNRIAGLTGSAAQIAAVAKAYRVYYAKHPEGSDYSMDHTAILYVMRPNGTMAGFMTPDTATPAMVQRLKELMAKG
ncbi:MAG: SCO family protein [Dongiaceae bacterium]